MVFVSTFCCLQQTGKRALQQPVTRKATELTDLKELIGLDATQDAERQILYANLCIRVVLPLPTRSLRKVPPFQHCRKNARDDTPVPYRSKPPIQPASSSCTINEPHGLRDRSSAAFSGVTSIM